MADARGAFRVGGDCIEELGEGCCIMTTKFNFAVEDILSRDPVESATGQDDGFDILRVAFVQGEDLEQELVGEFEERHVAK